MSEGATTVDLPALREGIRASQQSLAQFIPPSETLSVEESPKGVLLSCPGGMHRWTGVTTVEYVTGFDVDSLYESMEEALADSSGFTTEREDSRWGGQSAGDTGSGWNEVHNPSRAPGVKSADRCKLLVLQARPRADGPWSVLRAE